MNIKEPLWGSFLYVLLTKVFARILYKTNIKTHQLRMNYWTELSAEYAQQRSYLDDLFQVYPTIPEGIRELSSEKWKNVEAAFEVQSNEILVKELLKLDLFPIKDSYIAYMKRDPSSIARNPRTINRIAGRLYEM